MHSGASLHAFPALLCRGALTPPLYAFPALLCRGALTPPLHAFPAFLLQGGAHAAFACIPGVSFAGGRSRRLCMHSRRFFLQGGAHAAPPAPPPAPAKAGFIRVSCAFPGVAGLRLNHAFTIRPAADFYIGSRDLGL